MITRGGKLDGGDALVRVTESERGEEDSPHGK